MIKAAPKHFQLSPAIDVFALATRTVPPYDSTNLSCLGRSHFFLVDPGTKDETHKEWLLEYIRGRLKRGEICRGILLTHYHSDHTGSVAFLQEQLNIKAFGSATCAMKSDIQIDQVLTRGQRLLVEPGLSIEVLDTPGHCGGHLCFYLEECQVMVAGDMITAQGNTLIDPVEGHLGTYIESLHLLLRYAQRWLIPGHGEVISEPIPFLKWALLHRYQRLNRILAMMQQDPQSPKDPQGLAATIYKYEIKPAQLFLAERSVWSSLMWLSEQGLAEQVGSKKFVLARLGEKDITQLASYQKLVSSIDQLKCDLREP